MKKPKLWCLLGNRSCRVVLQQQQQQQEAAEEEVMHDNCCPILIFSLFAFLQMDTISPLCLLSTDPGAEKCFLSPQLISSEHVRQNVHCCVSIVCSTNTSVTDSDRRSWGQACIFSTDSTLAHFSV